MAESPLEVRICILDAIHFIVKLDGAIVNKVAYMVIGIDLDGHKDVLVIWIGENEFSKLIAAFKISCSQVQKTEAITACFPKTEIKKCVIDQIRNSIRRSQQAELKPKYKAATQKESLQELDLF